jgi:lipoprotein-anchoring transpeptidase ErfK/SrfK
MTKRLTRRGFLKLSSLAFGSLAITPPFPRPAEQDIGEIARVGVTEIDLYAAPRDDSEIIGKRYRDQIVHIYDEVTGPEGPAWNPLWYRVWGGYLHSAYMQQVKVRHNPLQDTLPEAGQLCEVTVPYTQPYSFTPDQGWKLSKVARLYYETTHWVTGIEQGPDGQPWYKINSEIDDYLFYYVPASHLRPIPKAELAPISPDVPDHKKRIHVNLDTQTLTCFENDEQVFTTRVSTGLPGLHPAGIPTATPEGDFRIYSKMPSKHMGSVTGNPDAEGGFSLPGVPWTAFFVTTGVAFHGTYWHNNFGIQMSHGCVNMRNEDAKWLFRWTTPLFPLPPETHADWERTGNGTRVTVVKR